MMIDKSQTVSEPKEMLANTQTLEDDLWLTNIQHVLVGKPQTPKRRCAKAQTLTEDIG